MNQLLTENKNLLPKIELFVLGPSGSHSSLTNLSREEILKLVAKNGAVLLRGFATNIDTFSTLVERVTPRTAIDPARVFFAKNVQLVDAGIGAMGLHCENGTTPLVPNLVWFYCERAAAVGSQTTLCDGIDVWNHLSRRAQKMLLDHRITFSRNVRSDLWLKYVKHHFPQLADEPQIDQAMLDSVFGHIEGSIVRLNDDGSLYLSHSSFAAHPTFFHDKIAFANSVFGPSYNYEAPNIQFEDGKPLPEWLLAECKATSERLTINIPWESGDIAIIDNTRVMHGRRRILDPSRKIYTALGFLQADDRSVVAERARSLR